MTAWLLTWLWQGTALAGAIALLIRCAPRVNAATKHAVWCGVLAGIAWLGWASSPQRAVTALKGLATEQPVFYVPSAPDFFLTIAIGIWAAIAVVNLVRLIPALHVMYVLRDRCRAFPASLEDRLPLWRETKDRGRRPQLMTCDAIAGATLLGLHPPCIAIPPSLVNALSPDELDQVILHEYAHVQRRDDWVRLVQSLALSALWIHPAAVLVSRAINRERETACDEWVVARTGLPKAYAQCLAHAAELRVNTRANLATPAFLSAFVGNRYELVRRVDRLLALRGKTRRHMSIIPATAATVAILVMSAAIHGVRFAEIGALIIPIDAVQPIRQVQQVRWARPAPRVPLTQIDLVQQVQPLLVAELADSAQRDGAPTSRVSESPNPIEILPARMIDATLAPTAQIASLFDAAPSAPSARGGGDKPDRWRALAEPGVEIASVAKKTSLGVANLFSRAGVSLARSF